MIDHVGARAGSRHDYLGRLLQIARDDGAFRAYDFGANIIAIARLHVVFNRAQRASREFHIEQSSVDVVVLRDLWKNKYRAIGMNFSDLVVHDPPPQIKFVDGRILKKHSIHAARHVADWRRRGVARQRFENHRVANFSGFNPLLGSYIWRIVAPNVPYLNPYSNLLSKVEHFIRLFDS